MRNLIELLQRKDLITVFNNCINVNVKVIVYVLVSFSLFLVFYFSTFINKPVFQPYLMVCGVCDIILCLLFQLLLLPKSLDTGSNYSIFNKVLHRQQLLNMCLGPWITLVFASIGTNHTCTEDGLGKHSVIEPCMTQLSLLVCDQCCYQKSSRSTTKLLQWPQKSLYFHLSYHIQT